MSVYRYDPSSSVNEIAYQRSAGGGARAYLFAEDAVTLACVSGIKTALSKDHYRCVATELENRPCLEVRGLHGIDALEQTLRASGYITGKRTTTRGNDAGFSLREKLSNNKLLLSGILNILGDCFYFGYGFFKRKLAPERGQWEDMAASGAYSTGSIMFAAFGRGDKSDHNARDISLKLREKMLLDGLTVHDEGAVQSFSESKENVLQRVHTFLQKHPAELGNAATAAAGGFIAAGALRSGKTHTKIMDGMLGLSTMAAGTTAALVKEKVPDPNAPAPDDLAGKALRWIRIRPNRIAGLGYMISTAVHGIETVRHLRNVHVDYPGKVATARWAYGMRGAFTTLNLMAEGALILASKGSGSGVKSDTSIENTAYAIVSDAISRQPIDQQEQLIREYSHNFLARHDVMGGEANAIERTLRARVSNLAANPWSRMKEDSAPNTPSPSMRVPAKETNPIVGDNTRKLIAQQQAKLANNNLEAIPAMGA